MSTAELDRSVLDAKDREELHAIAGAMGVNAPTRMRKAELIDAILAAAGGDPAPGGNGASDGSDDSERSDGGTTTEQKTVRSARASELTDDSIDALAAEEEAIAASATDAEPEVAPRPRRAPNGSSGDESSGASDEASGDSGQGREGGNAVDVDPEDVRESYGDGNVARRRRRRRGRGGAMEGGEPRSSEPVGEPVEVQGLLDLRDEGYGFLRTTSYLAGPKDVYVSASQVRRFSLRKGDFVEGYSRPQASNEKYPALLRVDKINAQSPDDARDRPRFEDLTPLFPDEQLHLELGDNPQEITGRIVDLIAPIGKGQRGMIVSPPKAGKTTILKQIVYSVERNNPEVHLMVVLADERPEEVTDMKRHVMKGEVVASTFDRPSDEHTQVAELAIERAKRLVEMGRDVVIILDGITRLARAYNLAAPA